MSESPTIEPVTGWRRRLPALAWLYAFSLFDLLCFLFFPYHAVINYAMVRFGDKFPAEITIANVQPHGFSTFKLDNIEIHPKGDLSTTLLRVDDLKIGWGWLSLIRKAPDLEVDAHLMGGRLQGTATWRPNDKSDVDLTLEGVNLAQTAALDLLRDDLKAKGITLGEMAGSLSASVKGSIPPKNPYAIEGDVTANGKDIQIHHGFGVFTGGDVFTINELSFKAHGEGGQIEFSDSTLKGPDGEAEFKGQLRLMEILPASLADMQLKFKLQDKLASNLGPLLEAKAASGRILRKNPDGSYTLLIRGPIKSSLKSL